MIFTKKWFIAFIAIVFLIAVFIDQNTVPVEIKFFFGDRHHVHLSLIIGVSLLTGAALTVFVFLFFRQISSKRKKRSMENEVTVP